MGTGITLSCGSWVELRKTPNKGGAEEWALGYLSGAAMWSPMSPLDGLDIGAVLVWLDNFCAQHPLVPFRGAIDEFIRQRAAIQAAQQQQQRQGAPPQPAPQPQQTPPTPPVRR